MLMLQKLGTFIGAFVLNGILLSLIFPIAFARVSDTNVYDQWNTLEEFEDVRALRELLVRNDWADETVDLHDLDYILVLTQQLSNDFFPNVPPALALAVISTESGFRSWIESPKGAKGLMQIVPKWHTERMAKYAYDESVDLYDPRLNIMTGLDYLNYILGEVHGDIVYALMWYNGGARYAQINYEFNHTESGYATTVIQRMEAIQDILERR